MNSMSKELSSGFISASNASDLWREIKEQFGGCSGPRIYELRRSIYSSKQGGDSVAMYYNKVKRLWDELACLKPNVVGQYVDEEKMMQFLIGLIEEFDATRNQVLLMDHLPSVAKAYGMMIQVEQQRALQGQQLESVENVIMHTRSYQNTTNVGNGMNTRNFQIAKSVYKRREVVDKSHLKCNFCGKTGHVRNGCFRLVGFLNGGLNLEVMEGVRVMQLTMLLMRRSKGE
ncbi:hypothetical protein LIER_34848 [Lithospermum erythrorhizon]|uniref:CCHC-type domain-containing protein n=1 Tax=Lithospermum erythrorhizon TaxID=34254 RepID=A0AAV3S3B4_LITER